ncbi:MAG TPA: chemotaxis protein CheD, partial [Elusimicrobiota bacterium]|nr:chemotaxis protein CheD [Elusimicrobiota bacterium]
KIFGGARVLPVFPGDGARVGDKNIALARDIVGRARIPIRGEDVGGDRGRKLIFCTDDGSAWVRRL